MCYVSAQYFGIFLKKGLNICRYALGSQKMNVYMFWSVGIFFSVGSDLFKISIRVLIWCGGAVTKVTASSNIKKA